MQKISFGSLEDRKWLKIESEEKVKTLNNEESELFKSLTSLFSGPITTRRTQTGRQLTRRHLDMYAENFDQHPVSSLKKLESYAPMSQLKFKCLPSEIEQNDILILMRWSIHQKLLLL